jgi:peptide methionine sulfoxide reductase MsrA
VSDKVCQPINTVVGYMGGTGEYPNYGNYTSANNYSETLRLVWDTSELSYADMLTVSAL